MTIGEIKNTYPVKDEHFSLFISLNYCDKFKYIHIYFGYCDYSLQS